MIVLDRARARQRALDLCRYIDAGPMPQFGAQESARRLEEAGFELLDERATWKLEPGRCYYTLRNGTTVIAFRVGADAPSKTGIHAVAAHLDSPNLRVKPLADQTKDGYLQLAVDVYGGALLATWGDRDLGLSGRVLLRSDGALGLDAVESVLIRIDRPIARVANVAIHLNRTVNKDGLCYDKQRHLPPLLGLADSTEDESAALVDLLARELGIAKERILDFDLGLHDVVPCTLGGLHEEFVFAPRLDNLACSHAGLVALLAACEVTPDPPETSWMLALYDHEECGSRSAQGALGTALSDVVNRLAAGHPKAESDAVEAVARTVARSFLVSADMAHAVHPNYGEFHSELDRPAMNQGPVIKRNDNQRYATDGESSAVFRRLCQDAGFEPQDYCHRSDLACGSTIGPLTSALSGIKTVDVGNPMLSMHSIREMCGTYDQDLMIEALRRLYR
jgi:aspartyl aminopeptidase